LNKADFDQGWQSTAVQPLLAAHPGYVRLPMGGGSAQASQHLGLLAQAIPTSAVDSLFIGAGSGTTARAIAAALPAQRRIDCIAVATANSHHAATDEASGPPAHLSHVRWHQSAGRFGRLAPEELAFIYRFWNDYQILLDPIYTVHVARLAETMHTSNPTMHIVLLHTGGLQGWASWVGRVTDQSMRVAIETALHQAFPATMH
jgi:1-aminocyclopropane-1-carboxylate deaminase